jgi:hypothetical protein
MVTIRQPLIPAFPIGPTTKVFTAATTGLAVFKGNVIRMLADGDITINYDGGQVVITAKEGDDYVFTDGIISVDVSAACMIG